MNLVFDMDGTLANFSIVGNCLEKMYEKGFFRRLAPFQKMVDYVNEILEEDIANTYILSAYNNLGISSPCTDKIEWVSQYLPKIKKENILLVEYGTNKAEYFLKNILKGDRTKFSNSILFDDYNLNLQQWENMGGFAVKVLNGFNSGKSWKGIKLSAI